MDSYKLHVRTDQALFCTSLFRWMSIDQFAADAFRVANPVQVQEVTIRLSFQLSISNTFSLKQLFCVPNAIEIPKVSFSFCLDIANTFCNLLVGQCPRFFVSDSIEVPKVSFS